MGIDLNPGYGQNNGNITGDAMCTVIVANRTVH